MSIHPLAMVAPGATVGADVQIGPFCVVEDEAALGDGCRLESHVVIKRGTTLGPDNHVCEGAVLGGLPQHVHASQSCGGVRIGAHNTFRENVTVHRALQLGQCTTIGDHCLLMANAHVAHDCQVANHVIMTNNAMLGGHVTVGQRANISGGVAIHQFCRVGTLAMVGGQARIVKDVPPFVTIDGQSGYVVGLNRIGLRRAGCHEPELRQLKAAYRLIYRSGLLWADLIERLRQEFAEGLAAAFHPFLATSARGIIPERRMPPGATIKLRYADEEEERLSQRRFKIG